MGIRSHNYSPCQLDHSRPKPSATINNYAVRIQRKYVSHDIYIWHQNQRNATAVQTRVFSRRLNVFRDKLLSRSADGNAAKRHTVAPRACNRQLLVTEYTEAEASCLTDVCSVSPQPYFRVYLTRCLGCRRCNEVCSHL